MVKTNLKFVFTILIGIMLFSNLVLAVPGIPNAFYGSVTWNGSPAGDGMSIVAKINGVQVASTTTKSGKYGYDPVFYVDDPDSTRSGKTINFFVNGVDSGETAVFTTGFATLLDLSATGGTTGGGTGGGGGGGGGTITTTNQTTSGTGNTTTPQVCQENWQCSDWSACENGIQTRTCSDENRCGTNNNEPFMSQPCSAEEIKETEEAKAALPTGFFLGMSATEWAIGIVIGIIAAATIIFLLKRQKKKY